MLQTRLADLTQAVPAGLAAGAVRQRRAPPHLPLTRPQSRQGALANATARKQSARDLWLLSSLQSLQKTPRLGVRSPSACSQACSLLPPHPMSAPSRPARSRLPEAPKRTQTDASRNTCNTVTLTSADQQLCSSTCTRKENGWTCH